MVNECSRHWASKSNTGQPLGGRLTQQDYPIVRKRNTKCGVGVGGLLGVGVSKKHPRRAVHQLQG